jgi:Fur family transcriptional regulator, ferric uptake regulator
MSQFYDLGIIRRIDFREGFERFEFQDHHHHHIVCTDCGQAEEFDLCEVEDISAHALKMSKKFKVIKDHSLELFGLCNKCSKV